MLAKKQVSISDPTENLKLFQKILCPFSHQMRKKEKSVNIHVKKENFHLNKIK